MVHIDNLITSGNNPQVKDTKHGKMDNDILSLMTLNGDKLLFRENFIQIQFCFWSQIQIQFNKCKSIDYSD